MDNELLDDPKRVAELWQALHRAARFRGATAAEADDIVQDTFVKALETPPRQSGRIVPWMRTVAERFVYRSNRGEKRRKHRERAVAQSEALPSVLSTLEEDSHRATLRVLVEDLSAPYGEVVLLRYFEELSVAEIAEQLGRRPDLVRKQISRGMRSLRERFQPRSGWRHSVLALFGIGGRTQPKFAALTLTLVAASVVSLLVWFAFGSGTGTELAAESHVVPELPSLETGAANLAAPPARGERLAGLVGKGLAPIEAPYSVVVMGRGGALAGAEIRASAREQQLEGPVLGTTDERGRLELTGVDPSAWVSASHDEMFPSDRVLLQSVGVERELVLWLDDAAGKVTGVVLSQAGEKLPGAKVTLSAATDKRGKIRARSSGRVLAEPLSRFVLCDEVGSFEIMKIPGNRYRLCVEAEGHAPHVEFFFSAGSRGRRVRCVLPLAATLSGIVRDSNSTPIPDAEVLVQLPAPLEPLRAKTDAFGEYRVELLPPGAVSLSGSGGEASLRESALANLTLVEGESRSFDLQLERRYTLAGRASDESRGALEGWQVQLSLATDRDAQVGVRATLTNSTGAFSFEACDPNLPYRLRLFAPGGDQAVPQASLEPVYAGEAVVELTRSAKGLPSCKLQGRADTTAQGPPALVHLQGEVLAKDLYLAVDPESGAFESPLLPPGTYVLRANRPNVGYGASHRVVLAPGEFKDVSPDAAAPTQLVTLEVPQLFGVESTRGKGAFVLVKGATSIDRFPILPAGTTAPVELPHGEYSFAVKGAPGWAEAYGSFLVGERGPLTLRVPLRAGKLVRVRVTTPRALLPGERVQLFANSGQGLEEVVCTRPVLPQDLNAAFQLNVRLPLDCDELQAVTNLDLEGVTAVDLTGKAARGEIVIELQGE